ncbi:dehydrodolichyl diphosphate synthase complex subunit DHDDS [Mycetomoellerius zeteki]|uniref:dehydrodolichyl diphosphate synthase complex subunit DHDDS n=1 Tax=Mycetomoellerius zeteki TaxID=64791 RepID=UPI00084E6BFE|nr:PREDICTED: dehydrodolichyl diphosphate synthase complex subunit DHDDS-like [Trachymyrmex zeteki]
MMSWLKERILNWFQFLALRIIKAGEVPKHVAFIMDGNRRYIKKQGGKERRHVKGCDKLFEMTNHCKNLGITEITFYTFSIENFKRSKEEVDELMDFLKQKFKYYIEEKEELMNDGICIRVIGNLSLVPEDLYKVIAEIMIITRENNEIVYNFALAYTCKYNYNEPYLCLHLILYITLRLRSGSVLSALLHHPVLCHPLVLCPINN